MGQPQRGRIHGGSTVTECRSAIDSQPIEASYGPISRAMEDNLVKSQMDSFLTPAAHSCVQDPGKSYGGLSPKASARSQVIATSLRPQSRSRDEARQRFKSGLSSCGNEGGKPTSYSQR
jgi:hypothetical protein